MKSDSTPSNAELIRRRLRAARDLRPLLRRAFGLIWAAAPRWSLAWIVLLVVQGVLPVVSVYLTRALVDSLVTVIEAGGGWDSARLSILIAVAMGMILVLQETLRSVTAWIRTAQSEQVKDYIRRLIHEKSQVVDLAFYDLPEYFDHLHRARQEAGYRPTALLENMGTLLQNSITLVAMAAVLIQFGWWLPLALFISTLPAFYVVLRYAAQRHRWHLEVTEKQRRAWYYDWILTARETAAEIRLFGLGDHFQTLYQQLRCQLREDLTSLAKSQAFAEFQASAAALLVTAVALIWMLWQAVQGLVSLGDLAMFYQAFNQGQRLLRSLLANVGQIYSNSLFLGDLFEFLAMEPHVVSPLSPVGMGAMAAAPVDVRVRNLTFHYPENERAAVEKLDLHLPPGQIAAIVGANGAGKSTLIKLLCRMYDPDEGAVEINGTDIRHYSLEEVRRQITVLFQTPVQYNATVAENIALGDLSVQDESKRLEEAARDAGADQIITQLPNGYETLLGKWFKGGTDLSTGEWQRIALARAFLRQCPFLILDEPTSAMDPWAESDWLARFRNLAQGRTALIITHRFTTAMHADVIHVMDAGRTVESGSHAELLAQNGRYAQSWKAQMREASSGTAITADA